MSDLKVVVCGAGGRMGAALVQGIVKADGLMLHAALEQVGASSIGSDAGTLAGLSPLGILVGDNLDTALAEADAIVDFTVPAASVTFASEAAKRNLIHVIGTTGCTPDDDATIMKAAQSGATIVKSGNMSLGFNLLCALVKQASASLDDEFDIEIVEMHHNQKVDAPSGAALMLGEAAASGRHIDLDANSTKSRDGIVGKRQRGTIGFAALRGGSVVGEHSVILAGPGERLELIHRSQDRALFANGAVKALLWAQKQKPGHYVMADVLGLDI